MLESKNKRLLINLIASLISFIVQMGISFLLTPILVEKLGNEAYGFIGLAHNFVSYATVLTVALNSMASRFITIAIHRGENEKANIYFSSVFIMNVILSVIVLIASTVMIINLEKLLNIPEYLEQDVKITFALAFGNFILSLLSTVYNIATFIKNRIDLSYIHQIIGNILKVIILVGLFALLKPKIYYISIGAIAYTLYVFIANIILTKKLAPELQIKIQNYRWKYIVELLKSGIWNSLNNLSTILLSGVDLLITNIFIDSSAMGILSIAKTIPTAIVTLLSTISNVFLPQFTILYSKNKKEELVNEVKFSIKILSLIMIVPMAGFIVFGKSFFALWLPSKSNAEIMQIQILSILTLLPNLVSCYIYTLYSINTVTNKLKVPVLVTLVMGIVSIILTYVTLKVTNLGVYAVAGISSVLLLLRVILFVPTYAAMNLKVKLTTFYKPLIKSIIISAIIIVVFLFANYIITIDTWITLIVVAILFGILGYFISFITLLNKQEKHKIINKVKGFLGGKA